MLQNESLASAPDSLSPMPSDRPDLPVFLVQAWGTNPPFDALVVARNWDHAFEQAEREFRRRRGKLAPISGFSGRRIQQRIGSVTVLDAG